MAVAPSPSYQEVYYFLATSPTHEQILAFRPSSQTQERIHTLLDAEKQQGISPDDKAELDEFEQVEHFVRMLKLHTRQLISGA
jgi:hypothetical protein